jgi:hypothetical protein
VLAQKQTQNRRRKANILLPGYRQGRKDEKPTGNGASKEWLKKITKKNY